MVALRLELAKEEAVDAARQQMYSHKNSPSTFLQTGLDLEEQQ